jgi:hypothetical protein
MVELDHVFVLCAAGAPEATALARVGLQEGSPNEHPGQGTACRRFFFRNAYLELLWVGDAAEAQTDPARSTRLWERWSRRREGANPFGIVLRPDGKAGDLDAPFATWSYRPSYLPPSVAIELAVGTPLEEPELFYMRWARRPDATRREPVDHPVPSTDVTSVRIGVPGPRPLSEAARAAEAAGVVGFHSAEDHLMTLGLDGEARGHVADLRPDLPLVLRW